MAFTIRRVPCTRDCSMRSRASSVQRCATFSPARWTTASPILAGSTSLRTETGITSSPRLCSALVSLVPMRPLAPVIVTLILLPVRASRPDGAKFGGLAAGVADLGAVDVGGALALGLECDGLGHRVGDVAVEHAGDHVVLAQLVVADDARDPARGGHLHLLGDLTRADVERAAEDPGEAEDVVDLVRVVAAARGDDADVRLGLLGRDLRGRVAHREQHRVRVHLPERIRGHGAGAAEADEQVSAVDDVLGPPAAPL